MTFLKARSNVLWPLSISRSKFLSFLKVLLNCDLHIAQEASNCQITSQSHPLIESNYVVIEIALCIVTISMPRSVGPDVGIKRSPYKSSHISFYAKVLFIKIAQKSPNTEMEYFCEEIPDQCDQMFK